MTDKVQHVCRHLHSLVSLVTLHDLSHYMVAG